MQIITIIAQTVFAGLLVLATFLLARHTRTLARITEELVHIEEEREKRIGHEQKMRDTERVYVLAEEIIRLRLGDFGAFLFPGVPRGNPNLELIKKIALQRAHLEDSDALKYLDELLRVIRLVEDGIRLEEEVRVKAIEVFGKFQTRLRTYEVDRWRAQLESRAFIP